MWSCWHTVGQLYLHARLWHLSCAVVCTVARSFSQVLGTPAVSNAPMGSLYIIQAPQPVAAANWWVESGWSNYAWHYTGTIPLHNVQAPHQIDGTLWGIYTGIFVTMMSLLWRHLYLQRSQSVQYFAQQFFLWLELGANELYVLELQLIAVTAIIFCYTRSYVQATFVRTQRKISKQLWK